MQPTLIETERKKRGRKPVRIGEGVVSPKVKERVLWMLEQGSTLTEIARLQGMPCLYAINAERKRDPQFDADIDQARVVGLGVKMDLCAENAEREAESRDPDRMRVAQMLAAVMTSYAEKIAPKQYGQLVKLGGDANAPLAVHVINYGTLNGGALTPVVTGNEQAYAREIDLSGVHDAKAAQSGKAGRKRAVSADRPRTVPRRLAAHNRAKAAPKAAR